MMKRTSFSGVSSRMSCRSSLKTYSTYSFFGISGWGIDLDYCDDTEWFALETNREHSVVFEIDPSTTAFQILLLTMIAIPFLLRDSCLQ